MTDFPRHDGSHGDSINPEAVLQEVKSYLDALDAWEVDRATEEDLVIIECLLRAVRAARQKGYSEDLLVQVLRSLIHAGM